MITAKIVLVPILKSSAFDKFPSRTLLAQGLMGLYPLPTYPSQSNSEMSSAVEVGKASSHQASKHSNKGLTLALIYLYK